MASHVTRVFDGSVRALHDVSLEVAPGTLVTIVGPSGCGKTTLLRILGGLDRATEGTVRYGAAPSIGFAFQEARLLPWRSLLDNVALPLELRGVGRSERHARAAELANAVGLGDALGRLPGQLSGGMRMRAAIARALTTHPSLLLLDEPFGALDEITRQSLDDLLLDLWRRRGMTVVMVTHSITEAVYLGQAVVVLAPGPGRVVHTMQPPFAERTPALRATAEFAAAAAQVLRELGQGMERAR
ncbi:MAG: ABC transporter ATP-binding protein [Phycisphaerae bacterium]|nr:ABC transporter ATP-binding protein [Phycisphaerae bacterium]